MSIKNIPKLYSQLEEELNIVIKLAPNFEKLVNFRNNETMPVHRWYYFKEGYSHQFVEKLLKEFKIEKGSTILDPFAGSGTTLLTAQWKGMYPVGIDINPFFTFVQRVKLDWFKYNCEELREEIKRLSNVDTQREPTLEPPKLSSFTRSRKPVFLSQTMQELLLFKEEILKVENELTRNLLLLALASILELASLVKKNGKGLKFVKGKSPPSVKFVLLRKLNDMFSDILHLERFLKPEKVEADVFTADTRDNNWLSHFVQKKAEFVMFSPPYLNTFDYTEVYKLELWFLDFVKNYEEFKKLRARTLRSHNLWNWKPTKIWSNEILDEIINSIQEKKLWTDIIPVMIQGYFDDMFLSLRNIYDCMEDDAYCIIVVGNSAYANIPIPTDLLLTKIAKDLGFKIIEIRIARQLTTSSQQLRVLRDEKLRSYLRESVIVFKK